MKKIFILVAALALASAAYAQVPSADVKLGDHDVLNVANTERQGCQSCHVPHEAKAEEYIWRWTIPTAVAGINLPTLDGASFHTNACMSCHDGVTAAAVLDLSGMSADAKVYSDTEGPLNDHPVNELLTQHGSTPPAMTFIRLYKPSGWVAPDAKTFGYVECGSCHDPHKGQSYRFLRAPSGTYATSAFAKKDFCRDCHGK